jgi:hypothetical protein
MKNKKSIKCRNLRGNRTKKRVKKTLRGGVGLPTIGKTVFNATRKFGTDITKEVIKNEFKGQLFNDKLGKKIEATKYTPPNYNDNKENLGNNNSYKFDMSKLPNSADKLNFSEMEI